MLSIKGYKVISERWSNLSLLDCRLVQKHRDKGNPLLNYLNVSGKKIVNPVRRSRNAYNEEQSGGACFSSGWLAFC